MTPEAARNAEVAAFIAGELPPRSRVLEVGCGRGAVAAALAAAGHEVTALDLELRDLVEAPGVRFVERDFLAYDDAPFGAIAFTSSLHHIAPLDAALDRAQALLRVGGLLVIDEFDLAAPDAATLRWYEDTQELLAATGCYDADARDGGHHGHGHREHHGNVAHGHAHDNREHHGNVTHGHAHDNREHDGHVDHGPRDHGPREHGHHAHDRHLPDAAPRDDRHPDARHGEHGHHDHRHHGAHDGHLHPDPGHRDGGHRDGGHRDGGHRDGGHRDGGLRDDGHRDAGHRDDGHRDDGHRDEQHDDRARAQGDLVARWRQAHEHDVPLHEGDAMQRGLAARFRVRSVARGPYLFRHIGRKVAQDDAGARIAACVRAIEERGIAAGSLRAVGLRLVCVRDA